MRSRTHNGCGVDPRDNKCPAATGQITAEIFVTKTLIPFFMGVKPQQSHPEGGSELGQGHSGYTAGEYTAGCSEYTVGGGKDTNFETRHDIMYIDKLDISLPPYTSFGFDEHETVMNFMKQLEQDCPQLMQCKAAFLQVLGDAYDSRTLPPL